MATEASGRRRGKRLTAALGAAGDARPVLFVTTEVPPDRVGAFRALAELVPIELALFGGGLHATSGVRDHGLPAREVAQGDVYALAASGRYRAVVAGTVGRTALPGAWLGAERARVPFVLWTALWAHPRSAAHLPGAVLLRLLYRRAAVVVTYGPHVSRVAEQLGARRTVVAPQAVDVDFWSAGREAGPEREAERAGNGAETSGSGETQTAGVGASTEPRRRRPPRLLFVGRDDPGKGVDWLLEAWARSGLGESPDGPAVAGSAAELRLVGPSPERAAGLPGVTALGPLTPARVREELRGAAAIVVPSERTATFREPWGLVVNEAMHAGTLVIASTEVGAVAGGLVVDHRTGLIVQAGNVNDLAAAMRSAVVAQSPELRAIRDEAHARASAYTHESWARAFAAALNGSVACPA